MNSITSLFQQAQLAEASYANFRNGDVLITGGDELKTALMTRGIEFSDAQATAFVAEWEVIDQIPNTSSGFSATVFKNKQTGAYSIAIRGSLQPVDFYEDANLIVRDGVAVNQLIDLYNYWQQVIRDAPRLFFECAVQQN